MRAFQLLLWPILDRGHSNPPLWRVSSESCPWCMHALVHVLMREGIHPDWCRAINEWWREDAESRQQDTCKVYEPHLLAFRGCMRVS